MRKRNIKRLFSGVVAGLAIIMLGVSVASAAPSNVTNFVARPSETTIILTWTIPSGATSTVIRYSTSSFPATPASGSSAYSGSGYQCTLSTLDSGQTYFFSAWGYDGASYSPQAAEIAVSTLAVGIEDAENMPSEPSMPSNIAQAPNASGLSLEPFTTFITIFNAGLGMPVNNLWEILAIGVCTVAGLGTYFKMRNFFIAWIVVLICISFGVGLDVLQGYLWGIWIIVGVGMWAAERYMQ